MDIWDVQRAYVFCFKANKAPLVPKQLPRHEHPVLSAIMAIPIFIPYDGPHWAERITARVTRIPSTIATRHQYLIPCIIMAVICWVLVRPTTTLSSGRGRITRISDSRIWASKVPWRPRQNCKSCSTRWCANVCYFKDCHRIIREKERLRYNLINDITYSIL